MNLKFWKRDKKVKDETTIQVQAHEWGVVEIYVKAQTANKALGLFKQLREELKEK